jgi:hypothetical protein
LLSVSQLIRLVDSALNSDRELVPNDTVYLFRNISDFSETILKRRNI